MVRPLWRGRRRSHSGLAAAELADRLPTDVRDTIQHWPFEDLPLHLPEFPMSAGEVPRTPGGSTVRFAGVIMELNSESNQASIYPYDPVGLERFSFGLGTTLGEHPERYVALKGLILDLEVRVDESESGLPYNRPATLAAVYGIERPAALDAPEGLVRGKITQIGCHSLSDGRYNCQLTGENDDNFNVEYSPGDASYPAVWAEGNVVGLRVHCGSSGSFMQDRFPTAPLQHSVLLQAAV